MGTAAARATGNKVTGDTTAGAAAVGSRVARAVVAGVAAVQAAAVENASAQAMCWNYNSTGYELELVEVSYRFTRGARTS